MRKTPSFDLARSASKPLSQVPSLETPASQLKPETIELSNGIPVVFQNFTSASFAAVYWWVRIGSADERPDEAGFAHFLEHMLFKDAAAKETGRASTGQTAQAIESLGGDINAYTSFDQTVYHVTCASQHWERVLDQFGSMAGTQKFLKSDFEREREVILEELRKNEDSPGRQLFQQLFTSTFSKHPYGRPVIGYTRTLKKATVKSLETFYRRGYAPEHMGLILVGPYDQKRKAALLKILEKRFGKKAIPVRKGGRAERKGEPAIRPQFPLVLKPFDVKTPTLSMSFRVPELRDPHIPALDVASQVLGAGELSRLYQKLFYQTSLVTEASAGLYVPSDSGMVYVQAEMMDKERIQPVLDGILREIERLKNEGPTEEELARVIVNAESEKLYATQTADGVASRLGFLRYTMGDLDFDRTYIEQLRAVDAAAVIKVAREFFTPERLSLVLMVPTADEDYGIENLRPIVQDLLSSIPAREVSKKSKGSVAKDSREPEVIQRPSGLKLIYRKNPQSHVFAIHGAVLGGLRLEMSAPLDGKSPDWGASHLLAMTWDKGSCSSQGTKDSQAIARIIEGSAASMEGFGGRNTIGLQMSGLARDWKKLSSLYNEVYSSPVFDETEVDHSRRITEDNIRGIDEHTSQLCSKLFLETLFETHPYGKLTIGSLDSIAALRGEKLRGYHHWWVRPERSVMSVVGNVEREAVEDWLDQLEASFAQARSTVDRLHGIPKSLPDERALKAPRWVEKQLGREQVHIIVGGLGPRMGSEDRYALKLLSTILGGQSGRLFIELREKKSLAYTVSPMIFEGMEAGYVGTYIACSPGKREEAIQGIAQVLTKLAEKGPTAKEMARAKEYYLGRRAMDLQSDSSQSSHFGLESLYGIAEFDESKIIKTVQKVSARQIQEVCRKYFVEPNMVTAVVG